MNDKSITSRNTIIEQAANSYSDSWEDWTVGVSANPITISAPVVLLHYQVQRKEKVSGNGTQAVRKI